MPLIGEPTVLATCVPCEFSSTSLASLHDPSGSSVQGPSIASPLIGSNGMSTVKFRLRLLLKFGAMSGWLPSTPVSMIPTRTFLSPRSFRYDPSTVAWIIRMSHWCAASGSGCDEPCWNRTSAARVAFMPRAALRAERRNSSENLGAAFARDFAGACPITRSRATPCTILEAAMRVLKLGFAEDTVATPILLLARST